ncbi:MAG: ParA family protein [Oscillospiraceae bacterium]|nr:ParA family protein [Oscillospiraceae bacterium]
MEKLITAIGNDNINKKIKKLEKYEVIGQDVQYQEALIEILEENKVDILILSELIEGENKIEELILKIKEINNNMEIIIILEKENNLLEKFLKNNGINNIFYNNELSIEIFEKEIKNINNKNIINVEEIKKVLFNNNSNKKAFINKINGESFIDKKIKDKIKDISKIKLNKLKNNKKNILISINGANNFKNSIFEVVLAFILGRKNKKILIIDFDILNKNLTTILGAEKFPDKIEEKLINKNIRELIININKNVDIISGIYFLIKYKFNFENIYKEIEIIKKEYDYVIVNSVLEGHFKLTKKIINKSNYAMFLVEDTLKEIKKSQKILNIYTNEWGIKKEKLFIVLNNHNNNYLNEKIIREIYKDYNIISKINNHNNYNLIINKNIKKLIINNEIKKDYYKLLKKIK